MKNAILLSCVLWTLLGCQNESTEPGVVATVNGRPIYLNQLKAQYDFLHLNWAGLLNPSVQQLRKEYGQILGDLIVQELIDQELERRGLAVTAEEMEKAEAEVRADYPEGGFETTLVEEYIDLETWRKQLNARLAREKFIQDVLRPIVKLNYQDAEEYYRQHVADFRLPPRVRLLHLTGSNVGSLQAAVTFYMNTQDMTQLGVKYPMVEAKELKLRADRIPATWVKPLERLGSMQSTPVIKGDDGFLVLILLERMPAKSLDASHAYPLVEKILLEQKLQNAFSTWTSQALSKAQIQISQHLLPQEAGVATSDEESAGSAGLTGEDMGEDGVEGVMDDNGNGTMMGVDAEGSDNAPSDLGGEESAPQKGSE